MRPPVLRTLMLCLCAATLAWMLAVPGSVIGAEAAPAPDTSGEAGTTAEATPPPDAEAPPATVPGQRITEEGEVIRAEEVEEPDLAELPLSNAARVRLDSARDSVVLVRGFFGAAATSAFHGTGFAVGDEGFIVTNYHVVSEAVLHPRRYRLEYVTSDGRRGRLRVHAVDVRNDLAVVKAEQQLDLPALRLRTDIPRAGARAYSIGYPLNLGLTITEGVANGLVASGFDQRIHYTGAINSGMSGGPALDAGGTVYGVNVSVISGRQLVGFVVPARHIVPLLRRAHAPLDEGRTPGQLRAMVAQQAQAYETVVLGPWDADSAARVETTQQILGFRLPTRIGPAFECSTTGSSDAPQGMEAETISCTGRSGVLLLLDLEVGHVGFQHRVLRAPRLSPLQFAQRVNDIADSHRRQGSAQHVADFACKDALVSLDGFEARITTCARQYRLFSGLYDLAVTVASISSDERAVITQLDLRGVGFEAGMQFVRRFLGAMQWNP
ncbi:MAG TPA: serine protease [Steroidobacteraceae bacterium]|nr:serine protease [Steroidobacteraceae bacterium]